MVSHLGSFCCNFVLLVNSRNVVGQIVRRCWLNCGALLVKLWGGVGQIVGRC